MGRGVRSGTTDIVDGLITAITLTGGSNGSTEQNTFRKWDYRAKDDFFSRLDEATQSTVTTRSGADEEGNPSLSQSIVNEREYDFYSQEIDDEPYGGFTRYEQRTTQRNREASRDAQTATISGTEGERRHKLVIDHAFESLDETGVSYLWEVDDLDEEGTYALDTRDSYSRTEKSDLSNYRSTHLVDENGLARDGEFTATSRTTVTVTDPKSPAQGQPAFNTRYSYDYFGPEYYGGDQYSVTDTEETAGLKSQVTTTTTESGSYYDVPVSSTYAVRVQSGDYRIDERAQFTDWYTNDDYYHEDFGISGWSTIDIDSTDQQRNTSQVVTTGSYGSWGIEERRDFRNTSAEQIYVRELRRDNAGSTDEHERYELLISNDNGNFSGHIYDHYLRIDENGVVEDTTVDEDLYGGTPPSGAKPVETGTQPFTAEKLDGGIFSVPEERREPQVIEPSWWVGVKAGFGYLWEEHKAWDNEEWDTNSRNLEDAGYGGTSAGIVGFLGALGERNGAGGVADALDGRDVAGTDLSTGQRLWRGTTGVGEIGLNAVGLRGAGQGIKKGAQEGFKVVKAGLDKADEAFNAIKGLLAKKADDAAKKGGKAAKPLKTTEHHIMTNKNRISKAAGGPYTQKFEELAKQRGITLNDTINKLRLSGHQGPHPAYNAEVFRRLDEATQGLKGDKFNAAFDRALEAIRKDTLKKGSLLNRLATGQGAVQ